MTHKILDMGTPFTYLGPINRLASTPGYDWAWQDGTIFGWSESNIRYEEAWWLNSDGILKDLGGGGDSLGDKIVRDIARARPFDPSWLRSAELFDMLLRVVNGVLPSDTPLIKEAQALITRMGTCELTEKVKC